MITPLFTLPLSIPIPVPVKKKRVLLVDVSPAKRDLRAEAMRKLGVDVDCAGDIPEACSWWRPDLYNLVLINMRDELGHRDKFCDDIRGATPPQQLAFLVGKPGYLADFPNADGAPSDLRDGDPGDQGFQPAAISGSPSQRWGIMEASLRISAVRSASAARSSAIQNRPTPPRDAEVRYSRRAEADTEVLPEIQKEEIQ